MIRVSLGFAVQILWVFFLDIRSVAGLARIYKVFCLLGYIEPESRGMVELLIVNFSPNNFVIEEAMKIGQMALVSSVVPQILVVDNLGWSKQGNGTFGSTGVTGIVFC